MRAVAESRALMALARCRCVGAACTFERAAIAPGRERTVVHAVLNPGVVEQCVLVERTLPGRTSAADVLARLASTRS